MTLDQNVFMTLAIQEAQKDDAQPNGSVDKSELPIQQGSASVPSYGTAGQDAEEASSAVDLYLVDEITTGR
ncbi:uncharacterized protein TrAtP1_002351 [Trichoderma atroviride]|uniref:uncharacterized protein n=1 Tax=Hypocrea atroviridis TaxID=63577 RepID=UPI003320C50F|nr:hypothetical protein TrAtP1_002351 [Trichoderma atroviride]